MPKSALPLSAVDLESDKFRLLTTHEIAKILSISHRTVEDWRLNKRIPFIRISRKCVRYRLSDVVASLEQHHRIAPMGG